MQKSIETRYADDMRDVETYVRDLVWAVNSPPLMRFADPAPLANPPLKTSDVDGEHLQDWLGRSSERRVGRYFERLVLYWIRHIRGCTIVAQSHQIVEEKRTVGEIDLLFHDEQGRMTHWEIAVKFYLQVEQGNPATIDYVGPNANDTLARKRQRLLEHQLPLSGRCFPEVEVRQAFVKGRIFYPWRTFGMKPEPVELATNHLAGRWLRANESSEFLSTRRQRYRILRKPFWLADEVVHSSDPDVLAASEVAQFLKRHFDHNRGPILMSGFDAEPTSDHELERYFVVPSHWPTPGPEHH